MTREKTDTLCGLWISDDGRAHVSVATPDGGRMERIEPFQPYAWLGADAS
jgi:hypothetical protein